MKPFSAWVYPLILFIGILLFFRPFFLHEKLPIPADTIIGLYHPYRDLYANDYPNGIPYKNSLITDPVRQQYPWKSLAITLEKQANLPLWNPYTFAGTPFLANFQAGAFYPVNILFFILPFATAWSIFIFLQPVLAGGFLYLYLRNLKLHPIASIFSSIAFAFGGFSVAWLEWGNIIHTALWLPLLLLAVDKIFQQKKQKVWYFVFLFSLVAAFFAGHLQTFFYLSLITITYASAKWFQYKKSKKIFITFILLVISFLVITFIQWWPTLQFILQSARDVDQIPFEKAGWFIPWEHLVQFIAPDFFGNPTTLNYWGVWNYGEFIGYVGIAPLVLAVFALCYRRDKKTIFFGSLVLLSLLFALPTFLAKLPYWLHIPFLSTAQPTRLLFVTDFSLVILAALGLDFLIKEKKKKPLLVSLGIIASFFAALLLLVFFGNKLLPSISSENLLIAKRNMYLPILLFAGSAVILVVYCFIKNKKFQLTLLLLLLLITTADLLRFADKFTPFTDPKYLFPPTKTLTYLQNQPGEFRILSTNAQILPPNFSLIYQLQTLEGYDPLYLRRHGELMAAIGRGKPDISTPFGFNRIITTQKIDSRLIDLLGVQYVLSLSDIQSPKFEKVFTEGQTKVYKNKNVFPRAFLVNEIKQVSGKEEAIQFLFDKEVNLKEEAVVEARLHTQVFTKGTASVISYSANKITITVAGSGQRFLVLMDSFYPTWKAKACSDGEQNCDEIAIYRTNYNFRGVIVPAEKKTIIFSNSLL